LRIEGMSHPVGEPRADLRAGPYPSTFFVLGTSRDSGKTVTCVGLVAKLLADYRLARRDIGYIKPVGQQAVPMPDGNGRSVPVDKDAVLVTSLMDLECPDYHAISPVVWLRGLTERCVDRGCVESPAIVRRGLLEQILASYRAVARDKAVVLVEGTGQLGVGSVGGVSNADVIRALRGMGVPVTVLMVARDSVGPVIDTLFPYLFALAHMDVPVDGLIVTRTPPQDLPSTQARLEAYYRSAFPCFYQQARDSAHVPEVLGCIPDIPELAMPSVRLVVEHFRRRRSSGLHVIAPADFVPRSVALVRGIRMLSLHEGYRPLIQPGDVVIVGGNANERIVEVLKEQDRRWQRGEPGISCLILSCGDILGLREDVHARLLHAQFPVLRLSYDSAEIARQVRALRVKVQPYDVIKRDLIARAYCEYLSPLPGMPISREAGRSG